MEPDKIWQKAKLLTEPPPLSTRVVRYDHENYITNDWNKVKELNLEEVILSQTDCPTQLCFFVQFDPKLNKDLSVLEMLKELQSVVSGILTDTFRLTKIEFLYSNPATDPNIYEIRVENVYLRGRDLSTFWNRIYRKPTMRLVRECNGVVGYDWFLLLDRDTISIPVYSPDKQVLILPEDWPTLKKKKEQEKFVGRRQIQKDDEFVKLLVKNCESIGVTLMYVRTQNPLMPRAARITLKSCCFGKEHDITSAYIDIFGEDGYFVSCCPECKEKSQRIYLDTMQMKVSDFLQKIWGAKQWMKALNAVYTQVSDGRIVEKIIDEYGCSKFMYHKNKSVLESYLKGHKYIVWDVEGKGIWELKDPAKMWCNSLDRNRCKCVTFNPQLKPGLNGDFLNTFEGFGFDPVARTLR